MNSRRPRRTYVSAKGPLAMAWERTGSVQVMQEASIKEESWFVILLLTFYLCARVKGAIRMRSSEQEA